MTLCLNCERSLEAGRHAIDSAERIVRNQAERIAAMKARIAELESLSPQPLGEIPYDATARPIEEVLAELAAEVPPEIWAKLPPDLTDHLDHYLYGTPKRGEAKGQNDE